MFTYMFEYSNDTENKINHKIQPIEHFSDRGGFIFKRKVSYMKQIKNAQNITIGQKPSKTVVKFTVFSSGFCPGNSILDATTGSKTIYKIGSKDEDRFFKVKIANGIHECPLNLYYSTPEQYEKQFEVHVQQHSKEKWSQKQLNYPSM
jgi:hypothetical protein